MCRIADVGCADLPTVVVYPRPTIDTAYYAVLFACSIAELTPAPIVGYGAGPLLGYGLLAAASNWLATQVPPNNSSKPTPLRGAA